MKQALLCYFLLFAAIASAQTLEKDTSKAAQLYKQAILAKNQRDNESAAKFCLQALQLYEKHQLVKDIMHLKLSLLDLYSSSSQYDKAFPLVEEIMALSKQHFGEKDTLYLLKALETQGIMYSSKGDYDKATASLFEALNICKKKKNNIPNQISIHRILGVVHYYKGDYPKALEYYKKTEALTIQYQGKLNLGLAALYGNIAALVHDMGRHEEALDYMLNAMEINESDSVKANDLTMARLYNNIAAVYVTILQDQRALEYLDKAEVLYKKTLGEEHPSLVSMYANKGNILGKNAQNIRAIEFYKKAIAILDKTKSQPHHLAQLYVAVAKTYSSAKDFKNAQIAIEQAIEINKSLGGAYYVGLADCFSVLATIHSLNADYKAFYEWQNKALEIALKNYGPTHPKVASSYRQIGDILLVEEKYNQALAQLDLALNANSVLKEATAQEIFEQKSYLSMTELIAIISKTTQVYFVWFNATGKKEHLEKAYQCILLNQKIVATIKNGMTESSDQKSFLESNHTINLNAIEIAYNFHKINDNNYLKEAFRFAELNKSAILLGVLKDEAAKQFGGLPDSIINQENELNKNIAALEKQILDAQIEQQRTVADQLKGKLLETRTDLQQFQKKINKTYQKYVQLKYTETNIDVNMVRSQLLDPTTAMLEYFVADSMVYLFLITKDIYEVYPLPFSKGELKSNIKKMRQSLSDYKLILNDEVLATQQYAEAAHYLYQKLIAPAIPQLKNIEHLIIIPDGEMGNVPFEVLLTKPWKQAEAIDYKQFAYLCKDFYISYSYSATWLLEAHKTRHKVTNTEILAIGAFYPATKPTKSIRGRRLDDMRAALMPLPSIELEIKELEKNLQGRFLYGKEATEQQIKKLAGNYGILHLAMHGLLDPLHPIASSLVLTEDGDSTEDNFLHAYEISQMDLDAALVVLSACETGYGKFEQGEGIMSMARSFMYAGVPSLVVSLWQVNDASTSILMKEFYKNLSLGQNKDMALTNAKMYYLEHAQGITAHPAFWAPFVQIGDTMAIDMAAATNWWWWIVGGVLVLGGGFSSLVDCGLVMGTYAPNDKTGYPLGMKNK